MFELMEIAPLFPSTMPASSASSELGLTPVGNSTSGKADMLSFFKNDHFRIRLRRLILLAALIPAASPPMITNFSGISLTPP